MYHPSLNKFRLAMLMLLSVLVSSCAGWNPNEAGKAEQQAREAIAEFKKHDPSLKSFFDKAYAYAVYPAVGKGGIGIGGAHGSGIVYQHGHVIGHTSLTQVTIGWQLGGESYREVIFFENQKAFNTFKSGSLKFSANGKFCYGSGILKMTVTTPPGIPSRRLTGAPYHIHRCTSLRR